MSATPSSHNPPMTAAQALERLRSGNMRFRNNLRSVESFVTQARREEVAAGQRPFAIILSCSDSRSPAELLFDCGLGDLFVVRVAGNVVAPSLIGSVEFAAAAYDTELVVVLGHSKCGAVAATLDLLRNKGNPLSENVRDIVERIMPSMTELAKADLPEEEIYERAIRANVRVSASHLRHGSRVLERRIAEGRLAVVGAEYCLDTGKVDFFDGISAFPEEAPQSFR